ncbi:MAG: hypothetical protein RLO52_09285, partial [Sandaracinaceae bacterium]
MPCAVVMCWRLGAGPPARPRPLIFGRSGGGALAGLAGGAGRPERGGLGGGGALRRGGGGGGA